MKFQKSWSTANAKQREKLLELIRRLAEDDKDGVMADKGRIRSWFIELYKLYFAMRKNIG